MTYEEAKMQIQAIPEKIWDQLSEPDREAMEMAFSALQAQEAKTQLSAEGTTSDLISRQAAIDVLGVFTQADALGHTPKQIVEALPSAQPEIEERTEEFAQNVPKEDLISRKAAIDALDCINGTEEVLRSLPSAQPEPCKDAVSREAAIDVAENAFVRGLLASPDIRRLPSVQPKPQWIPVSKKSHPDTPERVQVQLDNGWIITAYYEENEWRSVPYCDEPIEDRWIEAWMPLPEPYRTERRIDGVDS